MAEQNLPNEPKKTSRRGVGSRRLVGIGILALVGGAVILLMLAPVIFRGLDESMQFRLVRRFPFMADWQTHATPPFESLPTLAITDDNAAALLLTPVFTPTAVPAIATPVPPAPTPTGVVASVTAVPPTEVPASATATASITATVSPTEIPASATASMTATATTRATVTVTARTTLFAPSATALPTERPSSATITASATPLTPSPTLVPPTSTPVPTATPSVTPSPTATIPATIPPTSTQRPTLIPSPTMPPTVIPIPLSYHATGYKWVPQSWNNCGPANLVQALEPFDWPGDQAAAAAYLKPNQEDKNVGPAEMVKFVNDKTNVRAITRVAGDLDLIRRLVSHQFSVIMQTGFYVEGEGWMGHYLTVIGYDNPKGIIYGLDTFLGDGPTNQGMEEKIGDLDARWQHFNRTYIVLYRPERADEVNQILGVDADPTANARHALAVASAEAEAKSDNPFAWFNMGSSYVLLGQYRNAATAYDRAFRVGGGLPWRMLWYQFGPYAAYYYSGHYSTALTLVTTSLQTTVYVEETYYWRGMIEAATGKTTLAAQDFKHALTFNPNFTLAADALASVNDGTFEPPTPSAN